MRITRSALESLETHSREGYPFEVCGALLAQAGHGVVRAVPLENREVESPRVRYAVAPEDLLRLFREADSSGLEVVGYYHSHPDHPARPSETDTSRARESISDGVLHVVVGVAAGAGAVATAWVFRDEGGDFEAEPIEVGD